MLQETQLASHAMSCSIVQYLDDSIEVGEAAQVLILDVAKGAVLGRHELVVCQLLQDALLHLWMLTDQVPMYMMPPCLADV
jgi:hypothetical protein